MVILNKPYNLQYSIGVYVDGWYGGNGMPPHVFIGLKVEKVKYSNKQIENFKILFKGYKNYNDFIKEIENFNQEPTQHQLINTLSSKEIDDEINQKAWLNGENNNEYTDKREEFDERFKFFRICQTDITLYFGEFLNKNKLELNTYDEVVESLDLYLKENKDFLLNMEGFFGFGPYVSGIKRMAKKKFQNQSENKSGGKVYQNNQYDHDLFDNINYETLTTPKIPENSENKKAFVFSTGHILKSIRPLDTFFTPQAVVFENINADIFYQVAKKILLDTILSSDEFRTKECFFDTRNIFKDYRVIKNSCVDFVHDKMKIANILNEGKNVTPDKILKRLQETKNTSEIDKLNLLLNLFDINLFYQNYDNLCKLDSTWDSEKGLNTFVEYYNFMLHSHLLYDEKLNRLGNNKIQTLPRDNNIEYIEDDINMRLNVGLCVGCYFQDMLQYDKDFQCDVSLLCAKKLDNGKLRFLKADSSNDFVFSDFDFASNDTSLLQSYHLAINIQQPIIFSKIPHYNVCTISKESIGVHIQSFMDRYMGISGNSGDYRDMIAYNKGTRNA